MCGDYEHNIVFFIDWKMNIISTNSTLIFARRRHYKIHALYRYETGNFRCAYAKNDIEVLIDM